ncbi:unnamed protein product [Urochloa humidicola]
MAFRFVDPTRFIPQGFQRVMVLGRRPMTRVFLGNPVRRNLQVAIANIEHLPAHQAFVKFMHFHDRDRLIHTSPHVFGQYHISFIEHDRAWNHRAVSLNHEVWLMMLGVNIDYWSETHISKILGDYGQLLAWEDDPHHLGRVLVKARVVSLEDIPWFVVGTEGFAFEGDSWTIQTEIIHSTMLGAHGPDDLQPDVFDFFDFGQPGNGPPPQDHPVQEGEEGDWGLWPQGPTQQNPPLQENDANQEVGDLPLQFNAPPQQDAQQNVVPDLNMDIAGDFGDVIQGDFVLEDQASISSNPEHVIEVQSDESVGDQVLPNPENQVIPDLNAHVDVFLPMDNGVPLQINPDEIEEEDLDQHMAFPEDDQNQEHIQQDMMHLGFVRLMESPGDPVFQSLSDTRASLLSPFVKQNPDAVRLWAHHLAPAAGSSQVMVPKSWADFFTALLLNPTSFQWAKNFMSSQAMTSFEQASSDQIPFKIPPKCPVSDPSLCTKKLSLLLSPTEHTNGSTPSSQHLVEETTQEEETEPLSPATPPDQRNLKISPSTGPWSKALLDQVAAGKVDAKIQSLGARKSARKMKQLHGFKDASFSDKNCLGCSMRPPTMPASMIRNLGSSFCKIDAAKLTDEALTKKKKLAAPVEKRTIKKKPAKDIDDKAKQTKKKPKK